MQDICKVELLEKVNCIDLMMCDETHKIKDDITEYRTITSTEKIISIVNNEDKAARIKVDKDKGIVIEYESFLGIEYAHVQIGCKKPTWINLTNMSFNCYTIKFRNKIIDVFDTIFEPFTDIYNYAVYLVLVLVILAMAIGFNFYLKRAASDNFNRIESSVEQELDNTNTNVKNIDESLD